SRSTWARVYLRYPDGARIGSISPSASRKRNFEMVTSGNSGRSSPSTSPMLSTPSPRGEVGCEAAGEVIASGHVVQPGAGDEHQPELADLHLLAVAQGGRLDPLAVDVRPVEAAHVAHGEPGAAAVELGVPAGHSHVVEEDVAVRVAAAGGHVVVEQEPRPGVGAAPHDQQCDA